MHFVHWFVCWMNSLPGGTIIVIREMLLTLRKAVRATTILLPLLGLTYVLMITSPGKDRISVSIYVYFNAVLQSTQGLVVAICYCFVNGEVTMNGVLAFHQIAYVVQTLLKC